MRGIASWKRVACGLMVMALAGAGGAVARGADAPSAAPAVPSGPEILQSLKAFGSMGSVLMIAAHPDDENTQLITYLARGRQYIAVAAGGNIVAFALPEPGPASQH